MVRYNVQTAVDDTHHLIVAHEVTNVGNDRAQLTNMARQARAATGIKELTVVADRGYFKSEEVLQCHEAGITTFVPKPLTSGKNAEGYFGTGFYLRCPRRRVSLSRPAAGSGSTGVSRTSSM